MVERIDEFTIDRAGALVRSVIPKRGTPYQHRCSLEAFKAVTHAIDEAAAVGVTIEGLAETEDLPMTQVAVALAFLKERGCVFVEGRRSYGCDASVHLDGMVEYHALRERFIAK